MFIFRGKNYSPMHFLSWHSSQLIFNLKLFFFDIKSNFFSCFLNKLQFKLINALVQKSQQTELMLFCLRRRTRFLIKINLFIKERWCHLFNLITALSTAFQRWCRGCKVSTTALLRLSWDFCLHVHVNNSRGGIL
jgi:hypothetical protein